MKIIALNGSVNAQGNTAVLLDRVLQTAAALGAQTQMLNAFALLSASGGSPFCTVCSNPCSGVCYRQTPLEAAFRDMADADALVLGSPVYFGTVSAPLKALFDKTRQLRAQKRLYNRVGAAVAVGGAPYGGQETTIRALHDMMLIQGMILVGDGHGADDCGHQGVCAQRPASEHAWGLQRAAVLGRRLVEVCAATASLRAAAR